MTSSQHERRRFTRYPFSAMVRMAILIPDQTFTPMDIDGSVVDLSAGGIRVKSFGIRKNLFLELLKTIHYAKISAMFPNTEQPLEAKTSIVWLDYHDPSATEPAYCMLGMLFERFLTPESESVLRSALRGLEQR